MATTRRRRYGLAGLLVTTWLLASGFPQPFAFFTAGVTPTPTATPTPTPTPAGTPTPTPTPGGTTLLASDHYGYRPNPNGETLNYIGSLQYSMLKGETHFFVLKANTAVGTAQTLACAGNAGVSCKFYKLGYYAPDNSDQYLRMSVLTSPADGTAKYYDKMVEIPGGAANFIPEATNQDELLGVDITVAAGATAASDAGLAITLGTATLSPVLEILAAAVQAVPRIQVIMGLGDASIYVPHTGSYQTDSDKGAMLGHATDLLQAFRVVAYDNSLAGLTGNGGSPEAFNLDASSGQNGSWRQMHVNRYADVGWLRPWLLDRTNTQNNSGAVWANRADQTVANEAGIAADEAMYYFLDEPPTSLAATMKTTLEGWKTQTSTWMMVTADATYDNSAPAVSAGLVFSNYPRLVLAPVINNVDGVYTSITDYDDHRMMSYSSCQGNCQSQLNSNSTPGHDTGLVDLAYLDYPSTRARAYFWLTQRSTWKDKHDRGILHYDSVQCHLPYSGAKITPRADAAGNLDGTYFVLAGQGTSECFWFDLDNNGTTQPAGSCAAAGFQTKISSLNTGATSAQVNSAVLSAVDASPRFVAYASGSSYVNVVGGVEDGLQSAGTTGFTLAFNNSQNSWKSMRRFGVAGDGCFILPNVGGMRPMAGLPAFAKGGFGYSPTIRLATVRDSSYEADQLYAYQQRQGGTPVADQLVTNPASFETRWGEYEYLGWRLKKANTAGGAIAAQTLSASKLLVTTQPTAAAIGGVVTPAVVGRATNRLGGTDGAYVSSCTAAATGPGTLGGTTTVTAVAGVCTWNNLTVDTAGSYTLTLSSGSLTSAVTQSFTASGFNPESVTTATLVGWYDADNTANITKDGSNLVATWANRHLPGTNNLTQATGANKPVWTAAAVNTHAAMDFGAGGATQWLGLTAWTGGGNKNNFVAMFVAKASNTSGVKTFVASNGTFHNFSMSCGQSDKEFSYDSGNDGGKDGSTAEDQSYHVFEISLSGPTGKINWMRLDCSATSQIVGHEGQSDYEGYAQPQDVRIGVRNNGTTNPLVGQIAEVAFFDGLMSAGDRDSLCTAWKTKYGL